MAGTRGFAWLVTLVFVGVAMAGCSSGDSLGLDEDDQLGPAQFTETTAALTAQVLDDEGFPLASAMVGILQTDIPPRQTNADGLARFSNLEPGTYQVVAQKLGFDSAAQRVEVRAGVEAEATLVLKQILIRDTYHETLHAVGHMSCGFGLAVVTVSAQCPLTGSSTVVWDYEVTNQLLSIIAEVAWTPTSALSAQSFRITSGQGESCNPCTYQHNYGAATGSSPLRHEKHEPFSGLPEDADPDELFRIRHRIWVPFQDPNPPFVIIVLDQRFEIWRTVFYGEGAPEGFSARPDA